MPARAGRGKRRGPTRRYEGLWRRRGKAVVAGVDEAGRGCLAGPVVAAALILPPRPPAGIDDSKRLRPADRERLFAELRRQGAHWSWALATAREIETINIRQAAFLAMRRAVAALDPPPEALLVDGFALPETALPQRALIGGDARSLSIAAASIVAKVVRDRIMCVLAGRYPGYGFARHKGYPTPEHTAALVRLGPCRVHRRSFAPVARRLAAGTESATESSCS